MVKLKTRKNQEKKALAYDKEYIHEKINQKSWKMTPAKRLIRISYVMALKL